MRIDSRRRRTLMGLRSVVVTALIGIAPIPAQADDLARGDSAWARRADGELGGLALSAPILEAVSAYDRALAARPESLEARWKLLRALHFAGDFVSQDPAEKIGFFDRARSVSEEGLALLTDQLAPGRKLEDVEPDAIESRLEGAGVLPSDVARLYFWSAINWGAWSRGAGLLGAVRQGVANRLHRYTLIVIALEPGYDEGAAFRLLGRLHAELPRVPFVSSWVRRDQALPLLERAYEMAPENPGNRLLLAITLLDLAPEERSRAVELLERVEALSPRPTMRIEDLVMRDEARELLERWRTSSSRPSNDSRTAAFDRSATSAREEPVADVPVVERVSPTKPS